MVSLTVLLLGLVTAVILKFTYDYVSSPLRAVPGPLGARFTRLWYLYRVRKGRFHLDNIELHRKYGSVVRYAPNSYSVSDPDAIKAIYGLGTGFNKSDWYQAWSAPGVSSIFTIQDNKVHAAVRRKFQSSYSMSSLVTYEAFVDECTKIMRQRMEEKSASSDPIDMAWWFNCYATDTVAMITYSKRLGCLDAGEDVGDLAKTLHAGLSYASLVGIYAELHAAIWKASAWLTSIGLSKGTPRQYIQRITADSVAERRKLRQAGEKPDVEQAADDPTAPKDFLTKFLDFNDADPSRFTDRDIAAGLSGNVVAGADTTAATLAGILYWLLKYPSTLEKLRAEVDEGKSSGKLSPLVTFKESQEMPYLQAVIQEAQRLHPAVGLPLERVVPPGGMEISGQYFPEGTIVGINAWVLHYDTSVFGPDAAEFRPERWLEADKGTLGKMNHSWLPFGLGSRTCIGKNISMLEMSKLVPELVHNFDFELGDDLKGSDWATVNHWFVIPNSLNVRVKRRDQYKA